jgi:arylsulfatase A-like enzyme
VGKAPMDSYARRCLLARRLVERGVRYVQIFINGQIWDNHNRLSKTLRSACDRTDQPVSALLDDLKERGLLDSTLVLWGGEFGRLPIAQLPANKDATNAGRDHGPRGFSVWLAGGGIKGGVTHGATDEIGYAAAENRVSIADWHATILHCLGLYHDELVFDRNGFEEKLTSTFTARVVKEILA